MIDVETVAPTLQALMQTLSKELGLPLRYVYNIAVVKDSDRGYSFSCKLYADPLWHQETQT